MIVMCSAICIFYWTSCWYKWWMRTHIFKITSSPPTNFKFSPHVRMTSTFTFYFSDFGVLFSCKTIIRCFRTINQYIYDVIKDCICVFLCVMQSLFFTEKAIDTNGGCAHTFSSSVPTNFKFTPHGTCFVYLVFTIRIFGVIFSCKTNIKSYKTISKQ